MYADRLNGLIFDAVYVSWILSLPLFTLDIMYRPCSKLQFSAKHAKCQLRLSDSSATQMMPSKY